VADGETKNASEHKRLGEKVKAFEEEKKIRQEIDFMQCGVGGCSLLNSFHP